MARKIIIDCDPGIDDALALAIALFDPRLEVVAITACAGTVDAEQATQNVHALIERLDPPLMPRLGTALDPGLGAAVNNGTQLHGQDGLGNVGWSPAARQHTMPSDKLIADRLRADPGEVTVVCLGPLTGLAKALERDPALVPMIDRVIMAGGSAACLGDVTPVAEFNMHYDPRSAQTVFQSATTKSLVPLELSEELRFGWELVEQLPPSYSKVGAILKELVPFFCRSARQELGLETVAFQGVLPILALLEPLLFEWEEMAGEIEVGGELTRGTTVFDQRTPRQWRTNMEVATKLDVQAASDAFLNCLKYVGQVS